MADDFEIEDIPTELKKCLDNCDAIIMVPYLGHACVEGLSSKCIDAETWKYLTATAQEALLRDGFFPFKGISLFVYDWLPKEAQHLLSDNGYFCIKDLALSHYRPFDGRKFDDDIDDTIWDQMTIETQASLLRNHILPKKGIREVDWDKLSSNMKSLLVNNGFYPVLSTVYTDYKSASYFISPDLIMCEKLTGV